MKRWLVKIGFSWRRLAGIAVLALVTVWGIGEFAYPSTNPPGRHTAPVLSAQTEPILRRACFDCHSNETVHPWYIHLPGVGLVIGNHVREGREELNFSTWDQMDGRRRAQKLKESLELIDEGEMPVMGYTLLHPEAKLSPGDITLLREAVAQTVGQGAVPSRDEAPHGD